MGGCVSVHKNPDSNLKFRLSFGSKHDDLAMPSPVKADRPIADVALKSPWPPSGPVAAARGFGSKDETFFDSQPWLESDCDDDFVSVNGDFTPSRGNTPVHHNFSAATQPGNTAVSDNKPPATKPEPPPPEKKKRLSELFQESLRTDRYLPDNDQNTPSTENGKNETNTTVIGLPPKSVEGTPFSSVAHSACSSEPTPLGDYRAEREKQIKSAQCCLPRMLSSRSYNERKRMASPAS